MERFSDVEVVITFHFYFMTSLCVADWQIHGGRTTENVVSPDR